MAREERLSSRRHREGGNLTMLARGYLMTEGLRGDGLGGFNVPGGSDGGCCGCGDGYAALITLKLLQHSNREGPYVRSGS